MAVNISQLSFEHHRVALGIGEAEPRISSRFEGNATDWEQSGYEIQILRKGGQGCAPETFATNSSQSLFVPWPSEPLGARERARVRARAHGGGGDQHSSTPWSGWVFVETGLLNDDEWGEAVPIASTQDFDPTQAKRPVYFRKSFSVSAEESPIKTARLYITTLGVYEAEINSGRVGDHVLALGWQSYDLRHVYDTYDVTDLVRAGDNAIGVVVGEGWYARRMWHLPYEDDWHNHYDYQPVEPVPTYDLPNI